MTPDLPITLPYYATDLPRHLPTEAEIAAAPDVSLPYTGRKIVEIGPYFVVKFGEGVDLLEGENMLFVQERTKVPIPRVYALYSNAGKKYIVMERIGGQTLASLWQDLGHLEKEYIFKSIRSYFDELRALQPPGYYGSIGKRYLLDGVFWTRHPEQAINGPFISEEALLDALPLKYTYDGRSTYRADFFRQCLPHVLGGHKPVFTHGDFQRKNILIRRPVEDATLPELRPVEDATLPELRPVKDATLPELRPVEDATLPELRRWQVVILDWEKSGWYPSYWEYCMTYCGLRWDDDWGLWIREALDPYVSEAAWFQAIRLELWS